METLANKIKELKAGRTLKQLKLEDRQTYYEVQSLTSKLSEQKAYAKGQFITKEHLVEYKGLIIWLMKNKCNYRGYLDLKSAMTELLSRVESENIVFKTTKGIKGIVSDLAINAGLSNTEARLREAYGIEITESTYSNQILSDFQQFKLNALM